MAVAAEGVTTGEGQQYCEHGENAAEMGRDVAAVGALGTHGAWQAEHSQAHAHANRSDGGGGGEQHAIVGE